MKRSDVTRWKQSLYKNPPPYLIVLASSVKTKGVEVIEYHRIVLLLWKYILIMKCSTSTWALIQQKFWSNLKVDKSYTNHITLHERNIINLLKLLHSQVSLSTHITRTIDILSNRPILGLICYPLFSSICIYKYNRNHYGNWCIIHYSCRYVISMSWSLLTT